MVHLPEMRFKSMQRTIDFLRFSTGNTELFKMGEGQAGRVSVMIILGIL